MQLLYGLIQLELLLRQLFFEPVSIILVALCMLIQLLSENVFNDVVGLTKHQVLFAKNLIFKGFKVDHSDCVLRNYFMHLELQLLEFLLLIWVLL